MGPTPASFFLLLPNGGDHVMFSRSALLAVEYALITLHAFPAWACCSREKHFIAYLNGHHAVTPLLGPCLLAS